MTSLQSLSLLTRTNLYCASRIFSSLCRNTDYSIFLLVIKQIQDRRLEKDQAVISDQLSDLSATAEQCEKKMKELKVTLYARFGRAINLDE
jgi:hypothetical protein